VTTSNTSDTTDVLERFRRRVTAVGGLPTLPQVAAEVLRLAHDPDSSLKDMAAVISKDPPLTGRLLKVANSAFYGLSQQVGNLNVALVLLGMKNITSVVTSISIFRTLKFAEGTSGFTRRSFWEHSGACGKACDLLGKECRLDLSGEGFVTGLIHDVGKIMLDAVFHNDFVRVIKLASKESLPMHQAEQEILGVDHAQIGGWLASNWHLPESIGAAIAVHHDEPCDPENAPLGAALQLADAVVRAEGFGFPGFAPPPTRDELRQWPILKGADFPRDRFADRVREEFSGVQEFLSAAEG
jgi:HD-like signal output (HDOD) protein